MYKLDFQSMVAEYNHQMNGWRGKKLGIPPCSCRDEEEMFRHCRSICRTILEMEEVLGLPVDTIHRRLKKYGIGVNHGA